MAFKADRRIWLNADRSEVVEEGAADAAFLLAAEGDVVEDELVKSLGLKSESKPKDKAAPAPANKSAKKAAAKRSDD